MVADYLSCLGSKAAPIKDLPIDDSFWDDQLLAISRQAIPWYADLVNYKVHRVLPPRLSYPQKEKFLADSKYYVWKEPLLLSLIHI